MTMVAMTTMEQEPTTFTVAKNKKQEPLRECVRDALNSYFQQLDGHSTCSLYQMVISEVEQPMMETVMQYAEGNQTRAAAILGISRSTLRKKLAIYGLD